MIEFMSALVHKSARTHSRERANGKKARAPITPLSEKHPIVIPHSNRVLSVFRSISLHAHTDNNPYKTGKMKGKMN